MSTIAYGALTRRRALAGVEDNLTETNGIRTYVDALAALVPVEVLAAHALILSFTTSKATVESDNSAIQHGAVVSEPSALRIAFFGLALMSVALYVIGLRPHKLTWQVAVGGLIPAGAFIAWTMVQRTTAFDAVAPGMNFASREVVGVLAASTLPVVAALLAVRLNNSPPDPALTGVGAVPDAPGPAPATPDPGLDIVAPAPPAADAAPAVSEPAPVVPEPAPATPPPAPAPAPPAPAPPPPAPPAPPPAPPAPAPAPAAPAPAPAAPPPAPTAPPPAPPAPAPAPDPAPRPPDPAPPAPRQVPDDEDPDSTRIIPRG